MEPLNYLRRAEDDLRRHYLPRCQEQGAMDAVRTIEDVLARAKSATKFLIPSGRLLNDRLRGLPAGALRLPFPRVVIEYGVNSNTPGVVEEFTNGPIIEAPRRIVYAEQDHSDGDITIYCFAQLALESLGLRWSMLPYRARVFRADAGGLTSLPEFFGRSQHVPVGASEVSDVGYHVDVLPYARAGFAALSPMDARRAAYSDMLDETHVVLELIEALACVNVGHEALPSRPLNKSSIRRGAKPFDEYRVLVVKAAHPGRVGAAGHGGTMDRRSPREHLRRGHVRRLRDGRQLWVNACVVAAGAAGKVGGAYLVGA